MKKPPSALMRKARLARSQAYSPYSKFAVGAAVKTGSKIMFSGCNIENASFGMTICAERVAIFKAVSSGAKELLEVAISCGPSLSKVNPRTSMPCGACLQVMAEFGSPELLVHVDNAGTYKLKELLPESFQFSFGRR